MTVLVVGATGTVVPHVVTALTTLATRVCVLARDGARARTLMRPGVDVRTGDPLFRDGGSHFVTDDVARILSHPATTVERHLTRHPSLAVSA